MRRKLTVKRVVRVCPIRSRPENLEERRKLPQLGLEWSAVQPQRIFRRFALNFVRVNTRLVHFVKLAVRDNNTNKKLSYCWETARRERLSKIAEMDVEMTN